MGSPAQQNNQQAYNQVYYEPDTGQYFTYEKLTPENSIFRDQKAANFFNALGMYGNTQRNYLGTSLTSQYDRFYPQGTVSPYPSIDALFPALNAGLVGNLLQGTQPTGAMYGAGKYLTGTNLLSMPTTTTSESKGK